MSEQVATKELADSLRRLSGWSMWTSPQEPDAERRADTRNLLAAYEDVLNRLEELHDAHDELERRLDGAQVRGADLVTDRDRGYAEGYSDARAVQLPSTDLVTEMRLAGYHDWASAVERLARPAHERESPHCSNCSCGVAVEPAEWLESKEFYEVMQAYRHAHVVGQAFVCERFEAVKAFIRRALPPRAESQPFDPWTLVTDGSVVGIFMDQQSYPASSLPRPGYRSVIARGSGSGLFLTTRETSTLRKPRWDELRSMCIHGTINSASCDMEDCRPQIGGAGAAQPPEGGQ